jgi:hypothetical protein
MIRRMRSSGTIRQAWVIFALAAFMLRAATPAGYMLGADPETGGSWIYLCQPLVSASPTGESMPKSMGAMDHSAPTGPSAKPMPTERKRTFVMKKEFITGMASEYSVTRPSSAIIDL